MKKSKTPSIPRPLLDRLIVTDRPIPPKGDQKVGLIIVPENTSSSSKAELLNPHFVATVLATGPDCKNVKAGDRVIVTGSNCYPVKVGETTYTFTRDHEVVAIL